MLFLSHKLPTLRVMRMKMRMVLSTTFVGAQMSLVGVQILYVLSRFKGQSAMLAKVRSFCTSAI